MFTALFNFFSEIPKVPRALLGFLGLAIIVGLVIGLIQLIKRTGANRRAGNCSRRAHIATNVIASILCIAIALGALSMPIGAVGSFLQQRGTITGPSEGAGNVPPESDPPNKTDNLDRRSVTAEELNADNLADWIKLHISEDIDLNNLKLDVGSFPAYQTDRISANRKAIDKYLGDNSDIEYFSDPVYYPDLEKLELFLGENAKDWVKDFSTEEKEKFGLESRKDLYLLGLKNPVVGVMLTHGLIEEEEILECNEDWLPEFWESIEKAFKDGIGNAQFIDVASSIDSTKLMNVDNWVLPMCKVLSVYDGFEFTYKKSIITDDSSVAHWKMNNASEATGARAEKVTDPKKQESLPALAMINYGKNGDAYFRWGINLFDRRLEKFADEEPEPPAPTTTPAPSTTPTPSTTPSTTPPPPTTTPQEKLYLLSIRYLEWGTDKKLADGIYKWYKPKAEYSYKSPSVDGYELVDKDQSIVFGEMSSTDKAIIVYYKKVDVAKATVTIKYIDEDTNAVLGKWSKTDNVGTKLTLPKNPSFNNYTLVRTNVPTSTIQLPKGGLVYQTYYRRQTAQLTISYVDESTGRQIATPFKKTLKVGDYYVIAASDRTPSLTGYELSYTTAPSGITMVKEGLNYTTYYRKVTPPPTTTTTEKDGKDPIVDPKPDEGGGTQDDTGPGPITQPEKPPVYEVPEDPPVTTTTSTVVPEPNEPPPAGTTPSTEEPVPTGTGYDEGGSPIDGPGDPVITDPPITPPGWEFDD